MARYRKKPIVIDADQWNPNDPASVKGVSMIPDLRIAEDVVLIYTLEGVMHAGPGDWIIRGIKGEYYPCKNDIFMATYELVSGDEG